MRFANGLCDVDDGASHFRQVKTTRTLSRCRGVVFCHGLTWGGEVKTKNRGPLSHCGWTKSCTTSETPMMIPLQNTTNTGFDHGFISWCEMDFVHPQSAALKEAVFHGAETGPIRWRQDVATGAIMSMGLIGALRKPSAEVASLYSSAGRHAPPQQKEGLRNEESGFAG